MSTSSTVSRTVEIQEALRYADEFISTNDLNVNRVEVAPRSPGATRWNRETQTSDLPSLTTINVSAAQDWRRRDSLSFTAWCRAIGATVAWVHRRELDTCLHAWADRDGYTWRVSSAVGRPDNGPHLPGIRVEWERTDSGRLGNKARVSVDDLEIALRNLVTA